jgi:hypothetical protein
MSGPLRTYLHDDLADSGFAVEVLETLAKSYPAYETELSRAKLLEEVRADRWDARDHHLTCRQEFAGIEGRLHWKDAQWRRSSVRRMLDKPAVILSEPEFATWDLNI